MWTSGRVFCVFLAAAALISIGSLPSRAQSMVTLQDLAWHYDSYDGQIVEAQGTITAYRERVSSRGISYTAFSLQQGRASVLVIAWPHQKLQDGLRVQVTGTVVVIKTLILIKAQRIDLLRYQDSGRDMTAQSQTIARP